MFYIWRARGMLRSFRWCGLLYGSPWMCWVCRTCNQGKSDIKTAGKTQPISRCMRIVKTRESDRGINTLLESLLLTSLQHEHKKSQAASSSKCNLQSSQCSHSKSSRISWRSQALPICCHCKIQIVSLIRQFALDPAPAVLAPSWMLTSDLLPPTQPLLTEL